MNDTLVTTIVLAFVIVVLAIVAFSIGRLLTGKCKIKGGGCGQSPDAKKNSSDGTNESSCGICKKDKKDPMN